MKVGRANLVNAMKKGAVVVTGAAAIVAAAAAASPALAGGYGNTVNNCYGIYFNTDWDQRCGSGGASVSGVYNSTGDCTSSADRYVSRYRSRGNTTSVDGEDCRFQVVNVRTSFQ